MLLSAIFLLSMAIPTAFGDPLFQLGETQHAQAIEAFVNESFTSTVHNIQHDVPVENVVAMFDAAQNSGL
jgi:hypothetical protein